MKAWIVLALALLISPFCSAEEDWIARELRDATSQRDRLHPGVSFEICRNLLLVNQAIPLGKDQLQQALEGLAAVAKVGRGKIDAANALSEEFLQRAKKLEYVSTGLVWMPATLKSELSPEKLAALEKLSKTAVCPQCKGTSVITCSNCVFGRTRCNACMGTGRVGGSTLATRGSECLVCEGRGKVACGICRGSGFVPCVKCSGTGLSQ